MKIYLNFSLENVTREYVKVNSLSNTYNENKSVRFKTLMLRSNLCDYAKHFATKKWSIINDENNTNME